MIRGSSFDQREDGGTVRKGELIFFKKDLYAGLFEWGFGEGFGLDGDIGSAESRLFGARSAIDVG